MKVIGDPQRLTKIIKQVSCKGKNIGFVPTMGALHLGHLSLIKQAVKDNDIVVVSIFVNPAQFGPKEDFKKYPRPLKKDLKLCRKSGVDLVFLPTEKVMYPRGFSTFVEAGELGGKLCGISRPGHFRGVATVVAKLLNIVAPDILYLGQKDAQQAIIITKMIKDLNFPVKVKVMPTVRQKDGLALSSRNIYLNNEQKKEAPVLFKALSLAKSLITNGQRDTARIISRMRQLIKKKKQAKIDYIAIVDLEKLNNIKKIDCNCLISLAVKFGKTRLIDNTLIAYA
ncbi:MAG: pantoate--beta-alanine ligase [Candidatus Omnitrophica bacterium]|nr:pantoate--beta-alanine ligase [Candidatus Omnitrophota bacterium]